MTNAIMTIAPYRHAGTWVFDDEAHGLVAEPFVSGVPEMIDYMVRDIANAESGFRMIFSANPFPGYQQVAIRKRRVGCVQHSSPTSTRPHKRSTSEWRRLTAN